MWNENEKIELRLKLSAIPKVRYSEKQLMDGVDKGGDWWLTLTLPCSKPYMIERPFGLHTKKATLSNIISFGRENYQV